MQGVLEGFGFNFDNDNSSILVWIPAFAGMTAWGAFFFSTTSVQGGSRRRVGKVCGASFFL
jgi:hypothetical protein